MTIGDFETSALDGWGTDGGPGTPTLAQSTIGVTSGSHSLASSYAGDGGFWGPTTGNLIGEGFGSAISNATTLSYDLTLNSSNLNGGSGTFAGYAQANELALLAYGSNGAINLFIQRNWVAAGLSDSSSNSSTWSGVDGTRHIVWDLTKFTVTDPISGATNMSWAQIIATYPGIVDAKICFVEQTGDGTNTPVGGPTFFFDNVQFSGTNLIVHHTTNTLAIAKLQGPKGLYILTTTVSGNPQYQRQGIQTANTNNYSWVDGGNTTTYAMTITNFPSATYSNFEAHMFLVPFNTTPPTEVDPDWVEVNIIYFSVAGNSDGTGYGQFRYKWGGPANENTNLFSLITVTNPTPLGTWTMALDLDHVTITAPNGNSASTNMPSGASTAFYNPMSVYLGAQANLTNNIGQEVVFSGFQIVSNGVTTLLDNFTTPSLDLTKWQLASEDPTGVLQVPPSAGYSVTWNVPFSGFRLTSSTNAGLAGGWPASGLPISVFNGRAIVLIPTTYLATNTFYRLQNP